MPEPCHYCTKPVLLSKDNYRTMNIQVNNAWTRIIWHTACDPFKVQTVVTQKERTP